MIIQWSKFIICSIKILPMKPTSEIVQYSSLAVIVPAYNEEKGLARILTTLKDFPLIQEIIIVDDGSTDSTWSVANQYCRDDPRVKIIQHGKNQGKGQAVLTGLNESSAKNILTLDADLFGLKPEHLYDLSTPVIENLIDMTYAVFRKGRWNTDLSHILTPWLTGQRCLKRELFWEISWKAAAGYGLETAITLAARRYAWRTEKIFWKGVSHPPSENHRGMVRGFYNRIRMYLHIFRAWQVASQDAPSAKYLPFPTNRSS